MSQLIRDEQIPDHLIIFVTHWDWLLNQLVLEEIMMTRF